MSETIKNQHRSKPCYRRNRWNRMFQNKKERKTRKQYSWFLILEAGLCLFYMIPRIKIIKKRYVSSLGERNCQWSELPQEGMGYLYTSIPGSSFSPVALVVILSRWFKCQRIVRSFSELYSINTCFEIALSYKSYKIWGKIEVDAFIL